MEQNIIKIGNSIGIIIPAHLKKQRDLKVGNKVSVKDTNEGILITPFKKHLAKSVDVKFAKIVDEFITEHEDVLKELAHR